MIDRGDSTATEVRNLLVFGPQALSFNSAAFESVKAKVAGMKNNNWILKTIEELPNFWEAFTAEFPKYRFTDGASALSKLVGWFETDNLESPFPLLPNIILSPLVVITHVCEYLNYTSVILSDAGSQKRPFAGERPEILGFCMGFLSALAVSISDDHAEIEGHCATAIRLASIIGGIVDAQGELDMNGRARSFATAWNSVEASEEMDLILQRYPEAYVSVSYDLRRATITTAERTATELQHELRSAGIVATQIGLQGRFHSKFYEGDIEQLINYCTSQTGLHLPDASVLIHPVRSNSGNVLVTSGSLHGHALRTILTEHANWYQTFAKLYETNFSERRLLVTAFGPESCVPPTISLKIESGEPNGRANDDIHRAAADVGGPDDIAVVGMGIKVAGADDVSQFWDLLCEGSSQHKEVPTERVRFDNGWRELNPGRKWFGNFINDPEAFDHKFFKKNAREAASTDPQQRQLLQVAYQALEQAGYFSSPDPDRKIGCYIGVCAADYENNVACHQPNAYTAIGNLKSFIAGKLSHHFGWTASSMCIDSACSSSLVAVHLACKSILSGECNAALAGGVNIITNPLWFQNLAAASFLSPTGQCRPFDADADGYCRGEGIAAVILKKRSAAIADGDQILGIIPSTAVLQNQNCTPIFVPNAPSLSTLFSEVLSQSRLDASQIGYVEAHGTGTQVGDPAEYDSIRQVLGGAKRKAPLAFGSVKGLIGHTECTSGAVSLIKTVVMIQQQTLPPQASYQTLNPHLGYSADDNMRIVTNLTKWDDTFRAALINNYGASGSNASMIVTQAPSPRIHKPTLASFTSDFPFRFYAKDDRALQEYCLSIHNYLSRHKDDKKLTLANLSFNVCRQSNPALDRAWVSGCRSTEELIQKLDAFSKGDLTSGRAVKPSTRPVILCFGGQISTHIGLSREVFDSVAVLRSGLVECDEVCRSIGCDSIFPAIFERNAIQDVVKLQTMLFSMQYSCARTWISCGVQPVALVGHSFGELTAQSISGALSLTDAIKMIAGRASVIRDSWGPENGAMLAVEADDEDVERLLATASKLCETEGEQAPTVACFNGPRSFTIAGSSCAIDLTVKTISTTSTYSAMRFKKLSITNAFHSTLVQHLMSDLEQVGRGLTFNDPTIHVERATESPTSGEMTARYVADHMRNPVYFRHAVQRLARQHPNAVWLEAGSNSTITNMASRALGSSTGHFFQPLNITNNDNGLQSLSTATISLWKEGLAYTFWMHHRSQTCAYDPLILPSYCFEKSRHWIDYKAASSGTGKAVDERTEETPEGLWSFVAHSGDKEQCSRFRINSETEKYLDLVSGHFIARTAPICPATLEVDIALEAIISLHPKFSTSNLRPQICNTENQAPLCIDPSKSVWLDVEAEDDSRCNWKWKIISEDQGGRVSTTLHVSGRILLVSVDDVDSQQEFSRFERLIGHQRCAALLSCDDADDVIQGRNIYKSFAEVVDYPSQYRGVQKLVGKGSECAARIVKKYNSETWLDPLLSDCFSQAGGIWVNCMTDNNQDDMYIATGFEKWIRAADPADYAQRQVWDVYGSHHHSSDKLFLSDIFIFDPLTGKLLEVILGINYHKVAKASMRKILLRLAPKSGESSQEGSKLGHSETAQFSTGMVATEAPAGQTASKTSKSTKKHESEGPDVFGMLVTVLADISGLDAEEIRLDAQLSDIGIDSLMGMELARELEGLFKCHISTEELGSATDICDLVRIIRSTLGLIVETSEEEDSSDSGTGHTSSNLTTNSLTPSTSLSDLENIDKHEVSGRKSPGHFPTLSSADQDLVLPPSMIINVFEESKKQTDQFIADYRCAGYINDVLPKQTQLCVALTLEAFERLGCPLSTAAPGQRLERIEYAAQHQRLVDYLYKILEVEARLINIDGSNIVRTAVSAPSKSSEVLLEGLLQSFPDHLWANRLAFFAGSRLADVLTGNCDGIKLLFGTDEGRKLVSGLYGDSLLNKLANVQMQDIMVRLASSIPKGQGPLRVLELGAGTGGTTKGIVPILAKLNVPIEYTFTDLSGSFVAAARRTFKEYPFMKFRIHDIEKAPANELVGTQHVVIASNAIHATRNLNISVQNVRKTLRPDGFLMMLEMTEPVFWVDIIFGLFEGWWLFDDDRQHAIAHQSVWERDLHAAGYGHVDWTDGHSPEVNIQRVIIALASGPQYTRGAILPAPIVTQPVSASARKAAADEYVQRYIRDFQVPTSVESNASVVAVSNTGGHCVLVTGASGSLGTHLVTRLVALQNVASVVCLNRRSTMSPDVRQRRAMEERGLLLDAAGQSKLQILQTDSTKPMLGLSASEYERLVHSVTHIIHNAWPMSGKRPLAAMATQFQVLRNLIDIARDVSFYRPPGFRIGFQFVSSISVVGHYKFGENSSNNFVPEERMNIDSVLHNGYSEAKYICECILDETLHRYPDRFRTMVVRPGQIAGSRISGYWNPMEHLSFLVKSSQTLRCFPDIQGDICWTPVEEVAGTLADLVLSEGATYPVYHVDNPVRQSWSDTIPTILEALNIPAANVLPFNEWIRRVRAFPGAVEWDNPAAMLVEFLDDNFVRMSCGGLLLSTEKSCEHSATLAAVGPVTSTTIRKYIQSWKDMGFLHK